ncbi:hypothetical protein vseg_013569 [Gypsophila vaccaria]
MGRKAKATKIQTMKQTQEPNVPLEGQTMASNGNPGNLEPSPLMSNTSNSGRKKSKNSTAIVRRSRRLKPSATTQDLDPAVREILVSDSENSKEDLENEKEDETRVHDMNKYPEQTSDETERNFEEENRGSTDFKYKAMYIKSQKKIEALLKRNNELNKNLEHAVGKIDVYEKQSDVYLEVMNVIGSLSKATENLSAQVKRGGSTSQNGDAIRDSKRSRCQREYE